jgi:glycosyltransferase involved in cell wall biosynthesis
VLVPVHDAPDALLRTLASIRTQAVDYHVVVVDDGSTPPVSVDALPCPDRVTLIRLEEQQGVTAALNAGLRDILNRPIEYVARLDAGDEDVGDRLAKQADYLDRHADTVLVGAWTSHRDRAGNELFVSEHPTSWAAIRRRMRYRAAFSHSACMLRTSALRRFGGYDARYDIAQDFELFWRLAASAPCANLAEVLVARIEEPGSVTISRRARSAWVRLMIQAKYFSPGDPHALLGIGRSVLALMVPWRLVFAYKKAVHVIR